MTDKPNTLPLVVAVPMRFGENPALTGSSIPPVLTVQMDMESGPSYLVQLTEKAAMDLLPTARKLATDSRLPVKARTDRASIKLSA